MCACRSRSRLINENSCELYPEPRTYYSMCSFLPKPSPYPSKKVTALLNNIQVQSLGQEDPLEKEMATHSSTPAWKIPWTEEPGRLEFLGLQRVGHD